MELSINKEELNYLMYLSNTIVERRNTMPILANVKLTAENNTLRVAATDLEVSLIGTAEAHVANPGCITVDAKVLHDIVRELTDGVVELSVQKGQRLEIRSGQSRFRINTASAEEFPTIAGVSLNRSTIFSATKLYEMFDRTAFAVSTDETRFNINGVFLESVEDGLSGMGHSLRFVATDGHRLAMIDRPAESLHLEHSVIVPRKGIAELRKVLEANKGEASLGIGEGFFTLQSENVTIGVRLVDGQYPDYRQVIPQVSSTQLEVERSLLLSAVKRVSLVTTDKSKAVKMKLMSGNLMVSSSSPEYGEASESLAIEQSGEDLTIGFSARYVLDVLNALAPSEKITLKLNGDLGPGIFVGSDCEGFVCILMPMRFE